MSKGDETKHRGAATYSIGQRISLIRETDAHRESLLVHPGVERRLLLVGRRLIVEAAENDVVRVWRMREDEAADDVVPLGGPVLERSHEKLEHDRPAVQLGPGVVDVLIELVGELAEAGEDHIALCARRRPKVLEVLVGLRAVEEGETEGAGIEVGVVALAGVEIQRPLPQRRLHVLKPLNIGRRHGRLQAGEKNRGLDRERVAFEKPSARVHGRVGEA